MCRAAGIVFSQCLPPIYRRFGAVPFEESVVRRRRLIWLSAPVVVGLLSLASCSVDTDSGTFVGPPGTQSAGCAGCLDVIAVRVNPAQPTLTVGMTVQLTAEPVNAQGNILVGRTIAWASSDEDVAKVTSVGVESGDAVGSATISAMTGVITGTAAVTVAAPPDPA